MIRHRWSFARATLIVAAAALLTARSAAASPSFPSTVQSHLGLTSAPDCVLCHVGGRDSAGAATARQPLALTLLANGVQPEMPESLVAALDALRQKRTDSDGDGTPDIDELIAGTNPNDPSSGGNPDGGGVAATTSSDDSPRTGCGGRIAPRASRGSDASSFGHDSDGLAAAFVVAIIGLAALTRRRGTTVGPRFTAPVSRARYRRRSSS